MRRFAIIGKRSNRMDWIEGSGWRPQPIFGPAPKPGSNTPTGPRPVGYLSPVPGIRSLFTHFEAFLAGNWMTEGTEFLRLKASKTRKYNGAPIAPRRKNHLTLPRIARTMTR
jgi:hypothetical protein